MCKQDYATIERYQPLLKSRLDADTEEDYERNAAIRRAQLTDEPARAPEVKVLSDKRVKLDLLNKLQTYKILENLASYIAKYIGAELFTNNRHLGPIISLHSGYMHETHNLHTDIPSALKDGRVRSNLESFGRNYLSITFVLYLMASSTLAPEGQGATVVASTEHTGVSHDQDTRVSVCPFANCLISVFPGDNYHAVAPNPGLTRATIAYKVLMKATEFNPQPTWKGVEEAIDKWVETNNNKLEPPQQLNYKEIIEAARTTHKSFLPDKNPYTTLY